MARLQKEESALSVEEVVAGSSEWRKAVSHRDQAEPDTDQKPSPSWPRRIRCHAGVGATVMPTATANGGSLMSTGTARSRVLTQ